MQRQLTLRCGLRFKVGLGLAALALGGPSTAEVVYWSGNGHYYEAVLSTGNWNTANAGAIARGGYLATITSGAENTFVYGLVSGNDAFWYLDGYGNGIGPWLGGYQLPDQSAPDVGWQWVTDEAWSYTNWNTNQGCIPN
jgi:hypothetical protein